jgi:hypothetical protein
MPFFQGDFIQAQPLQDRQGGPIHLGTDPALHHARHCVVAELLFATNLLQRAVHQLQQDVLFRGLRVRTLGLIPLQFLSSGGVVRTIRTFIPLRTNLKINAPA